MGKLHELLAVEPELKKTADAIFNETVNTFNSKKEHFTGLSKTYHRIKEESEPMPDENKVMVTTVREKLDYTEKSLVKAIDAMYQKEATNTTAKADLVFNGETIASNVPAVVLLGIENKLKQLQGMYRAIPTLDPAQNWDKDPQVKNVYKTPVRKSYRTQKETDYVVVAPASDKHAAQVAQKTVDRVVGEWETVNFSGAISPLEKSEMLERLDNLLRAVKQARCRANEAVIPDGLSIGEKLFSIINA